MNEIKSFAEELNVKEEVVKEMEYRFSGHEIAIDYGDDENDDDKLRPISYLEDDKPGPSDQLSSQEDKSNTSESLKLALNQLDERSRLIIEDRWLNENKNKTLHDLANQYNVSAERIRQIEQAALNKIKLLMSPKS